MTSARDRLRELPEVFLGRAAGVKFAWPSAATRQYLHTWKKRGLISHLGGRSDAYVNNEYLTPTQAPNWGRALALATPSATIIGLEALRIAGWITQIVRRPAIAVDVGREPKVFQLEKFDITPRPTSWFQLVARGLARPMPSEPRLLHPSWALADLLAGADWGPACGIAPDDVDWDLVDEEHRAELTTAGKALGTPMARLRLAQDSPGHHR